jgi:hypothetical protein
MSHPPDQDLSSPTKKVQKVGTPIKEPTADSALPTRDDLRGELASFSVTYSSPLRDRLRSVAIQNHHRNLMNHYSQSREAPTPDAKLFLQSGRHLVEVGPDSVVEDRGDLLRQIGEVYLNQLKRLHRKSLFKKTSGPFQKKETPCNLVTPRGSNLFGGELPNSSTGLREVKTKRTTVERKVENSFFSALARFGPMIRARKSLTSGNGFRVHEFKCCQGKGCKYHCRLYYPMGDEICYIHPSSTASGLDLKKRDEFDEKAVYRIMDRHEGAGVVTQLLHGHSCSKPISLSQHLKSRSSTGLHPTLKEAIHREGGMHPYHLPKPNTMLSRIREQCSHDIDVLFPPGCLGIVSNQITEYWGQKRQKLLNLRYNKQCIKVSHLPNIKSYREVHSFVIDQTRGWLDLDNSVAGARAFFETYLHKTRTKCKQEIKDAGKRSLEHEIFCLPIPTEDDPDFGSVMQDAHLRDEDGLAYDNIVLFTSLNLIRQAKVVRETYDSLAMACIDTTHGSDANGGKLLSFGYVSMKPTGKKHPTIDTPTTLLYSPEF